MFPTNSNGLAPWIRWVQCKHWNKSKCSQPVQAHNIRRPSGHWRTQTTFRNKVLRIHTKETRFTKALRFECSVTKQRIQVSWQSPQGSTCTSLQRHDTTGGSSLWDMAPTVYSPFESYCKYYAHQRISSALHKTCTSVVYFYRTWCLMFSYFLLQTRW